MTQQLNILIVEDETLLAEMHVEFIRQHPACREVWLAGNLAQSRTMIARFKPDLILLDNFLPDGKGIELLYEIHQQHLSVGVVFTTAASDMETVSEAVRTGVFDYLIKPIAYERLGLTLERYCQRQTVVKNHSNANQKHIDSMFNAYARGEKEDLPVGIDMLTLNKIRALFVDQVARYTAESVAEKLSLSRTTARRYLEYCSSRNQIVAEIVYGKVGRPQRIYRALVGVD